MSTFGEEKNLFIFHPKKSSPPLVGEEEGEGEKGFVMLEDVEVDDEEGGEEEEVALRYFLFLFLFFYFLFLSSCFLPPIFFFFFENFR